MRLLPQILFEDEHIAIINKPTNYLSIPDRFNPELPSVMRHIERELGKVFVVHRLDRETSGIMCVARHAEAHRHLSIQFEKRQVDKIYLALAQGIIAPEEGKIEAPLMPHPAGNQMMVSPAGKPSLTLFRVIDRFRQFTLAEANIKTGRMHQVRVHFAFIGNPLVGDSLYGKQKEQAGFFLSDIKRKYKLSKWQDDELPVISRTALHALRLTLHHPQTEERMTFETELPKDFRAVLTQLRKWGK